MADRIAVEKAMSLDETRIFDVTFLEDLKDGVTVVSAEVVHVPPDDGIVTTPVIAEVSSPIVSVQIGPLNAEDTADETQITGVHTFFVLATLSDDETSAVCLEIKVIY
jgi:hypothetical protein